MQGIGRHKQPEVLIMGYEDLQALSVYLGILRMSFGCSYQYVLEQVYTYKLMTLFVEWQVSADSLELAYELFSIFCSVIFLFSFSPLYILKIAKVQDAAKKYISALYTN